MINSLLNAAKIDSLLLTILIILGVVVAGALIVYLLWEVVMSVARKNKKSDMVEELRFDEPAKTAKKSDLVVADYALDQEKVVEEPVVEQAIVVGAEKMTDVDEVKAEEEKAQLENDTAAQEKENAERRAYLEARRQELLRRMQVEAEEEPEEEVEAEEEEAEIETAEVEEKTEPQEAVAEKIAVAEVEEVEEKVAEQDEQAEQLLEEERKALEQEKEKYAAMVRELEAAKKILAEQTRIQAEKQPVVEKVVETVVTNESALSLEEIKEKLALAEERLKATEKEFKQCKKEYIPLKRVWNAYEKDQKKLRRKEALVAKQKVLLYGVNNYADIDPDKANKLAEDLDLLDGLKLSVQHCEEVMKNNEERYPLLEKMYNVLKLRNDELKKDIATYKAEIERIESENAEETEE